MPTDALSGVTLDHIEFYVEDVAASVARFVEDYGFAVVARGDGGGVANSVAVRQGRIVLVLTEGVAEDHPASVYVRSHGDGVANIALGTTDSGAAYAAAVARGARPVAEPTEQAGYVTAAITAFGDVVHTFVQRPDGSVTTPPGLTPVAAPPAAEAVNRQELRQLDHLAVCLPAGDLAPTVRFYESTLSFDTIFSEQIVVGAQAMNSQVVQSESGQVTLTLIEPDVSRDPGQIDRFVKDHGGAGIQHVAFTTPDIVGSVATLRRRGVAFLETPDSYYDRLSLRLTPAAHTIEELREHNILVDSDHDGQLFQIFTESTHPRRTFFVELIERLGARTFGSGNIRALYEAVSASRGQSR